MSSEAVGTKSPAKPASTQAPVRIPSPVSDPTENANNAPVQEVMTREQRLAAALEDMIHIQELGDPHVYLFRGSCKKCGWQTHQMIEDEARRLVRQHVQQHWKDAAMIAQNS